MNPIFKVTLKAWCWLMAAFLLGALYVSVEGHWSAALVPFVLGPMVVELGRRLRK